MKRSPIKQRRDRPRRDAGRVQHTRTKPKAGAGPDALERKHMAWVASLRCLVCGKPATVHHVTGYADRPGRIARSHKRVVPLCPQHHQKVFDPKGFDPVSVEGLGHQGFFNKHNIDLLKEAELLWKATECERG